jgi:hypothetical protein
VDSVRLTELLDPRDDLSSGVHVMSTMMRTFSGSFIVVDADSSVSLAKDAEISGKR